MLAANDDMSSLGPLIALIPEKRSAAFGLDYFAAAKNISSSLSHLNGGALFVALLHTAEPGSTVLAIHVVDVHTISAVRQASKPDIAGVTRAERSRPNHDVNRFGD